LKKKKKKDFLNLIDFVEFWENVTKFVIPNF